MEYLVVVVTFIIIALLVSLIFSKMLHIKVFGGFVMMFIVSTVGALLGSYYLPRISNILEFIKVNVPYSILGAIFLIIVLYIFTPKSIK